MIFNLKGFNGEIAFSEQSMESGNKKVQEFIEGIVDKNGVHPYFEKAVYVFLNGINVNQGDEAVYFTEFVVDVYAKSKI